MEDYLHSSDIEFEPDPSKASSKTPGLASIAQIVADAEDDRNSSKKTVKQLEFGSGAPSTRLAQELWIGRFNAFRQFTLKQSLDKPFGGDDLVRFFDAMLDKLSDQFREYLRSPQNDPYQSEDRSRVHVDCKFLFSNHIFEISTIFVVGPRRAIPNGRVGIVLRQKGLLKRITYRSVPREILKARGNDVEEGVWGDIVIEEHLTLDDELIIL